MVDTNGDAPRQGYAFLRKLVPKKLQPLLRGLRKRAQRPSTLAEPYRSVFPFTQVHPIRQQNLIRLAAWIEANNVPGAVVECGVLDGGTAALMAFGTARSGREVHLFDSWKGLPTTSEKDGAATMWAGDVVGSQRRVVSIFKTLNINLSRLIFHRGWFDETFPKANIDQIALLHVDADFYDSVRLTLLTWEPHVSPGGYIQIDDYSAFIGCRRAVDEYLIMHPDLKLETFKDIAFYIQKPLNETQGSAQSDK
jgi:O-methyltransferase